MFQWLKNLWRGGPEPEGWEHHDRPIPVRDEGEDHPDRGKHVLVQIDSIGEDAARQALKDLMHIDRIERADGGVYVYGRTVLDGQELAGNVVIRTGRIAMISVQ